MFAEIAGQLLMTSRASL
ncbi:hypothetical protein KL905_005435, partial [Ogataea polymorpha]